MTLDPVSFLGLLSEENAISSSSDEHKDKTPMTIFPPLSLSFTHTQAHAYKKEHIKCTATHNIP